MTNKWKRYTLFTGFVVIVICATAFQIIFINKLHQSEQIRQQYWLERFAFLSATEINAQLLHWQQQLAPQSFTQTSCSTKIASWQEQHPYPQIIRSAFLVSSNHSIQQVPIPKLKSPSTFEWLEPWLFESQIPKAFHLLPLVIQNSNTDKALVVFLDESVFWSQLIPDILGTIETTIGEGISYRTLITATQHPRRQLFPRREPVSNPSHADIAILFFPPSLFQSPFSRDTSNWSFQFEQESAKSGLNSEGLLRLSITLTGNHSQKAMQQKKAISYFIIFLLMGVMTTIVGFGIVFLRRSEQLSNQQMAFMTGISHELRTPLTAIVAASDNLAHKKVATPERVAVYGQLIRAECHRLETMVDTVLDHAKAYQESRLSQVTCNPLTVLNHIIDIWQYRIRERQTSLVINSENNLPDVAVSERTWSSILTNLLSNALKYGNKGQTIVIQLRSGTLRSKQTIEFSIQDQGKGIAKNELPHIYDRFFRGQAAKESQAPGTGLGLSLVKQLVKNAGGELQLHSKCNYGTKVTIAIPAVKSSRIV